MPFCSLRSCCLRGWLHWLHCRRLPRQRLWVRIRCLPVRIRGRLSQARTSPKGGRSRLRRLGLLVRRAARARTKARARMTAKARARMTAKARAANDPALAYGLPWKIIRAARKMVGPVLSLNTRLDQPKPNMPASALAHTIPLPLTLLTCH